MKVKHWLLVGVALAGISLAGCGNNVTVTLQDGNQTYVYQGEKCRVRDILDKFGLEIGTEDTMSAGLGDYVSGNSEIVINRKVTVDVVHNGRTTSITIVGGKIADALEAAGVSLKDADSVNFSEDDYLYDGMKIVVNTNADTTETDVKSVKNSSANSSSNKTTNNEQATAAAAENGVADSGWNDSWEDSWDDSWDNWEDSWDDSWDDDDYYSDGYDEYYYAPDISDDSDDSPAADIDDPEEDEGGGDVYVVSSVRYDDCDGSGHGVMVTTYSDGSQTEEYY